MVIGEIIVKVESDISVYVFEILEDNIRNLLEKQGIKAEIFDSVTGNSTKTRNDMMNKNKN